MSICTAFSNIKTVEDELSDRVGLGENDWISYLYIKLRDYMFLCCWRVLGGDDDLI